MSVMNRGIRNAFRNTIRTGSIIAILALVIALAVVMLLSVKAVDAKIKDVKGSVGNTITVTPAGSRGFQGGGDPLTSDDVAKIESTPHVVSAVGSVQDRLRTEGSTSGGGFGGNSNANATTSLVSAIEPGTLGQQNNGSTTANGAAPQLPAGFSLPITVTGTTDPTSTQVSDVSTFKITAGSTIDGTSSENVALVGKDLATKNNLTVGSTFTAYGQPVTVKGIYDTGNTFTNSGVIMPLAALETLSGQTGVTSVNVTVDSVENVDQTVSALESRLGTSVADVVSDTTTTSDTVSSLDNIRTIALYSLIGALVAGSVIILLSMVMIVRERRREIGVLKAIGSSNAKISFQFVTEALTLTLAAAAVGILLGIVLANPVLDVLVTSESSSSTAATAGFTPGNFGGGGGGGAGGAAPAQRGNTNIQPPRNINFGNVGRGFTNFGNTLSNLSTTVGFSVLLYGLLAAILIAVLGSAVPSYLIAKVRPAEVMRAE